MSTTTFAMKCHLFFLLIFTVILVIQTHEDETEYKLDTNKNRKSVNDNVYKIRDRAVHKETTVKGCEQNSEAPHLKSDQSPPSNSTRPQLPATQDGKGKGNNTEVIKGRKVSGQHQKTSLKGHKQHKTENSFNSTRPQLPATQHGKGKGNKTEVIKGRKVSGHHQKTSLKGHKQHKAENSSNSTRLLLPATQHGKGKGNKTEVIKGRKVAGHHQKTSLKGHKQHKTENSSNSTRSPLQGTQHGKKKKLKKSKVVKGRNFSALQQKTPLKGHKVDAEGNAGATQHGDTQVGHPPVQGSKVKDPAHATSHKNQEKFPARKIQFYIF